MQVPQSVKTTATLDVKLTAKEISKYTDEAVSLMAKLSTTEEEYKIVKREWNANIKEIKNDINKFIMAYKTKSEERTVECEQFFDVDKKEKWFVFDGVEYDRTNMDEFELQQASQGTLFGDGANLPVSDAKLHDEDEELEDSHDVLETPPHIGAVL